jgi:hypothetical protein
VVCAESCAIANLMKNVAKRATMVSLTLHWLLELAFPLMPILIGEGSGTKRGWVSC